MLWVAERSCFLSIKNYISSILATSKPIKTKAELTCHDNNRPSHEKFHLKLKFCWFTSNAYNLDKIHKSTTKKERKNEFVYFKCSRMSLFIFHFSLNIVSSTFIAFKFIVFALMFKSKQMAAMKRINKQTIKMCWTRERALK